MANVVVVLTNTGLAATGGVNSVLIWQPISPADNPVYTPIHKGQ
jgi:hypothetical protein